VLLRFPLLAWYFAASVDFMYNTARGLVGSCNPVRDWSKFMIRDNIGEGVFLVLTWVLWLAVLSHFVGSIGRDGGAIACRRQVSGITPGSPWGIISFIGVLFSLFVSDPDIHKGSPIFIVPFIVLLLGTAWYWYYFVRSLKVRSS